MAFSQRFALLSARQGKVAHVKRHFSSAPRASLGLDFGTESVRAILLGLDGLEHATHVVPYPKGQIARVLPQGQITLGGKHVAQCAQDWTVCAGQAARGALAKTAHLVLIKTRQQ